MSPYLISAFIATGGFLIGAWASALLAAVPKAIRNEMEMSPWRAPVPVTAPETSAAASALAHRTEKAQRKAEHRANVLATARKMRAQLGMEKSQALEISAGGNVT